MPDSERTTPDVIVRVRNLSKDFDVSAPWLERVLRGSGRRILRAVDGVSFDLNRAETLALVGESGCGKSTLARMLSGLYRPSGGSIEMFGREIGSMTAAEVADLRRRVNMIFQDPYASLNPRWKVFDIVAEPLRVQQGHLGGQQVAERVREAISLVRLPLDALEKYPHQFSGGQRQRISIARAITSRPDFLICDEPTSALDVSVQAQVLNLMKELQQQTGVSYLFISHNLAVVHHMSDRVGVMYLGRLVELAEKTALFEDPRHPYTQMLLAAIPHLKRGIGRARTRVAGEVPSPLDPPGGCAFHPRCPYAEERCRREVPELSACRDGERPVRFVACHRCADNYRS